MHVLFYLPSFPNAVLYSQPHMHLHRGGDALDLAGLDGAFTVVYDAEVARAAAGQDMNPCEGKALKLSQTSASTGMDRCCLPTTLS